jgi:hypothetical protein
MTNKEKFAETYAQAFSETHPQFTSERMRELVTRAVKRSCDDIKCVSIDGEAFKLTAKRLGIKHTYKAFSEFLNEAR